MPVDEGEFEVAPKVRELGRDRAEHPVVIEPGLPDRHDPRVARPGDDRSPVVVAHLVRVVRMDADGRVKPGEPLDTRQGSLG